MDNFKKITASVETLGDFLASLQVADGPWDSSFHEKFCSTCDQEDCDATPCPHEAERNNPTWWLKQKTGGIEK